MENQSVKKRSFSALLAVCLMVVLFAGIALAAPLKAKAAVDGAGIYLLAPNGAGDYYKGYIGGTIQNSKITAADQAEILAAIASVTPEGMVLSHFEHFDFYGGVSLGIAFGLDSVVENWMLNMDSDLCIVAVFKPFEPFEPPAPDYYSEWHYDFGLDAMVALNNLPAGGSLVVDLPMSIEYVPHFVLDALYGTGKTLVINRDGYTFRINGRNIPESMLGHNQLLHGNLDGYIV